MNNFGLSIASAVLCLGMGSAQATFMPWQEGWFFPDFDDPSAPLGFGLDDSRIYEYAGIFIGNVGKPGDGSDTINFSWPGLAWPGLAWLPASTSRPVSWFALRSTAVLFLAPASRCRSPSRMTSQAP